MAKSRALVWRWLGHAGCVYQALLKNSVPEHGAPAFRQEYILKIVRKGADGLLL